MSKGPREAGNGAETDEDPTIEDVRQTAEWVYSCDHVEMVNFEFVYCGSHGPHLQILDGFVYNLSSLDDSRIERAHGTIEEAEVTTETVTNEVAPNGESKYLESEISGEPSDHYELILSLLRNVYDTGVDDLDSITRSVVAHSEEELEDVPTPASTPEALREQCEVAGIFDLQEESYGGVVQLDESLDLNVLSVGFGLNKITYEPAVYPAFEIKRRTDDGRVTVLAFESGQVAAVDAPSVDAVEEAIIGFLERVDDLDLLNAQVPGGDEISYDKVHTSQ